MLIPIHALHRHTDQAPYQDGPQTSENAEQSGWQEAFLITGWGLEETGRGGEVCGPGSFHALQTNWQHQGEEVPWRVINRQGII